MKPLGRTDLTTLVDPYALEVDQTTTVFTPRTRCATTSRTDRSAARAALDRTELFTAKYGSFDPTWQPVDCAEVIRAQRSRRGRRPGRAPSASSGSR